MSFFMMSERFVFGLLPHPCGVFMRRGAAARIRDESLFFCRLCEFGWISSHEGFAFFALSSARSAESYTIHLKSAEADAAAAQAQQQSAIRNMQLIFNLCYCSLLRNKVKTTRASAFDHKTRLINF